MRPRLLCIVVLGGAACAEEMQASLQDAGSATDAFVAPAAPAQGDLANPDFAAAPEPPRTAGMAAAPPNPGPCPQQWRTVDLDTGHYCEPALTPADCPPGELAGFDGACRPFSRPCPADGWPDDLPTDATVIHVDPAAPAGGDGQRTSPFAALTDAIGAAPDGAVIALRAGAHLGPVELDRGLTLWGACASGTRLTALTANEEQAILRAVGPAAARHITVTGPRPGVEAGVSGAVNAPVDLSLQAVEVTDVVRFGVVAWPRATLAAEDVWVHGVSPRPSSGTGGHFLAADGGTVTLRRGVFEDGARIGVLAIQRANVTLEDLALRRVALDAETFGLGAVVATDAQLRLTRAVIEDVNEIGILAQGGQVDADFLVVRDVAVFVRDEGNAIGLWSEQGGRITVRGGALRRVGPFAAIAFDPTTRMALFDVWAGEIDHVVPSYTMSVAGGSRATIERLWIDDEAGVAVRGEGSEGFVRDLILRAPADVIDNTSGALAASEGARSVTATAVEATRAAGVIVTDPDSRLRVRGLRVRHDGASAFAGFVADGTLEVSGAVTEDAAGLAIAASIGGTLIAEDVVVRRATIGVAGNLANRVEVDRLLVEAPTGAGVWLIGGQGRLEDVRVDGLTGETTGRAGVHVTEGATVTLARLALTDLVGNGLRVMQNSTAAAEDVRIEAQTGVPTIEFGLFVRRSADLTAARVSVRNFAAGVIVDGQATLEDVAVGSMPRIAYGFAFGGAGQIHVRRARFVDLNGVGLYAQDDGALTAEDVFIDNVLPASEVAVGFFARDAATIDATRIHIRRTGTAGMLASDDSRVVVRDLRVEDTARPVCLGPACDELDELASGVYAQDRASVDVERFELVRADTAGFFVTDQSQLDARVGVVRACGFGLLVESDDYDPGRATDRVQYLDNGRDTLVRSETFPAVRVDPSLRPANDDPFEGD